METEQKDLVVSSAEPTIKKTRKKKTEPKVIEDRVINKKEAIDVDIEDEETLEQKAKYLKEKKRRDRRIFDEQIIKGKFKYYEVPKGTFSFWYKLPYKECKVKTYYLRDNTNEELPRGVARHLNNDCKRRVHEHMYDEKGKATTRAGEPISRFEFQPYHGMADLEYPPHLQ